jgi:hypothetical protein
MGLAETVVLQPGDVARRLLGPLELWIGCLPGEWRVAVLHDPEEAHADRGEQSVGRAFDPPHGATLSRFTRGPDERELQLEWTLPDQAVVVRPDPPIGVLPGDETRVFVGCPLWLRLVTPDGRRLLEVPTVPLPRTWFGPDPRVGELCWALRSKARMSLEEMPRRAYRALTVLSVSNQGADPLVLERLRVPVPHLSVARAEDGQAWTEQVLIVRPRRDDEATVEIGGFPELAGPVHPVSPPRRTGSPGALFRAFGSLLSWEGSL